MKNVVVCKWTSLNIRDLNSIEVNGGIEQCFMIRRYVKVSDIMEALKPFEDDYIVDDNVSFSFVNILSEEDSKEYRKTQALERYNIELQCIEKDFENSNKKNII
jgi:hypothetical protein